MAMVAGHANIGRLPAPDVISRLSLDQGHLTNADQDTHVRSFVERVAQQKIQYWSTTEAAPDDWPGPTVLLATASPDGMTPRVWTSDLSGAEFTLDEILTDPGIKLEGSYDEVFALLYGFDWQLIKALPAQLGLTADQVRDAFQNAKVLRPIDKMNLWTMPTQDAIDLAVFLATVQVEMDRFLPGTPACGGAIDVMVLEMAPHPSIKPYLGKTLHHPHLRGKLVIGG